ncbi:hypothetical protein SVAN01_07772 [Stagonosporopsis vannaccii]|nr:hypothetical protein SVAN01_07772 [Stagonosporopsis vannaccii]
MAQPIPICPAPPSTRVLESSTLTISPLLALPGELRNRIYTLALCDILTRPTLPGLAHPKRLALTTREAQLLTRNWRLFRRSCLGLTQTCRLLRAEFLPLFRAGVPIHVRTSELEAYIKVFGQPLNVGWIRVEMCDGEGEVDVKDAVLYCARNPRVKLDFGHQRLPMARLLMSPGMYGSFYAFVAKCVDRLVVVPTFVEYAGRDGKRFKRFLISRLEAWVKEEFGVSWMQREAGKQDVNWLAKWRVGLGLPDGVRVVPRVVPRNVVTCDMGTQTAQTGTDS